MRFRGVWLVAVAPLLALPALSACSAPDPGAVSFSTRGGSASGDPGGGSSGGTSSGGTSSGGVGDDGGGGGGDDGGGGGGPPNAFTGAPGFVAGKTGGATDNASHAASFTSNDPGNPNNPLGQNCLDCHKAGGAAAGAPFVVGGTVYTSAAATAGVGAGFEVRVRFPDGTAMSTYTDKLGNFYLKTTDTGAKPLVQNALAGARDGMGDVSTMSTNLAGPGNAGCNQANCHKKGSATGVIHVP